MTNKKNKLIPKLRFPEFENDGEWEEKKLGDITNSENSTLTLNKIENKKNGFSVYGADGVVGHIDKFQHKERYISIVKDGSGVGRLNLCEPKSSILGTLSCIKSKNLEKFDIHWIYYLMNTINFTSYKKGTGIPHIYYSDFKNELIPLPSLEEQQKIANCLSSLDELIEAQEEKLKLLKEHKKGLMQQLFPQANDNRDITRGGNLPKLRFPEFINDGAWEEKTLGEISFSIFDGTHQTPKYTEEGIPFFSVENLISKNKNKFISKEDYLILTAKNKPEKDDILITRIGNIGFSTVVSWDYEFSIYVTLATVKKSDKFIPHYLNGYFQSEVYQKEIRSKSLLNAVPMKINMNDLRNTKVLLPTIKEQQKIADCLSSLDETIEAQDQKIELLKQQKKGLIQGLFPVMN